MKKGSIYTLLVVGLALLVSCAVQVQTYDLSEDYAVSLHNPTGSEEVDKSKKGEDETKSTLAGVPARSFYGGDLKRGAIWWASKGITIEKGDEMLLEVTHIGADSLPSGATNTSINNIDHPFGATFPPLDLTKEEVALKVSIKIEPSDTSHLTLSLQLSDADGYQTNTKFPSYQIVKSEQFLDYYFDLRTIVYNQNTPEPHKVNGALINGLQFFLNKGEEPGYSGKISFQEIRIVPASAIVK